MSVEFKKGDTADPYTAVLEDDNGPVDITGYSQVRFFMKNVETGNKKIQGAQMNVVNPSEGKVRYEWSDQDVDTVGTFEAEVVVTFVDGDETFPSEGFKSISINEDIEEA